MTPHELIGKAMQAAASARLLLASGDADGACNRAYYAMFDAARAAILASGASVEPEVARWATGQAEVFIQTVNADFLCSASDGAMVRRKLSLQRILFAGTDQPT